MPKTTRLMFALAAALPAPLYAGTFDDIPVLDVSGDGIVFADPAEGVLEPGIQAVTGTPNADYPNTSNPSGIDNCLMANNPDIVCTAPPGSGKRIKTWLTGMNGMEILLSTQPSAGITEYYVYGKTSNMTGSRITGFTIELGTGSGADFVPMDMSDPAVAALFDPDFSRDPNLPDGLFGSGGQEGAGIGFFDGDRATMDLVNNGNVLDISNMTNAAHLALFGDAMLDDSLVPDAFFWDATGTPLEGDEDLLIAWHNVSQDAWVYGNLGLATDAVPIADRLTYLADSIGVTVADLGYVPGGDIPDNIVALMEASDLYSVDIVEDLRNLNLNFIIDLGDVEGNEISIRLTPIFPDIVQEAQSEYQFITAGHLDAAANVPYLDLGNAGTYQAAITDILAMDAAQQAEALERTGFSFMSTFSGIGYELGRAQVKSLNGVSAEPRESGAILSTKGLPNGWSIDASTYGFASFQGAKSSYDTTASGIGYDISNYSVSAGIERRFGQKSAIGFVLGAGNASGDAYNNRGSVDASSYSLAVFGRQAFGQGGVVQAMVGYQGLSFDTSRNVMGTVANGETNGSQLFAALEANYMIKRGALSFGPMAGIEYYHQKVDGFSETGAGAWNLTVGDQSGDVTVATVGMKGEYLLNGSSSTKLTGSLAYTMASGDDQLVQTGFVGLPGTGTPVGGMDQNWVDLSIGFSMDLGSAGSAGSSRIQAGYLGSFGSDRESHGIQIGYQMAF